MKIYFAGSIRGGRNDNELYLEIIKLLNKYGTVLTEHIGDIKLSQMGEDGLTNEFIYKRDMGWLKESDVVVAEVTTPSLGVGYELGKMENQKPILCLFREQENRRLSAMIHGNSNMVVKTYRRINEVEKILESFFQKI